MLIKSVWECSLFSCDVILPVKFLGLMRLGGVYGKRVVRTVSSLKMDFKDELL